MLANIDNFVRENLHNTKYGKIKNLEENPCEQFMILYTVIY